MTDVLVIVPARGGSQRLRRKNLLPIDGVPLFLRAVWTGLALGRVVVSTDDDEIASMARARRTEVHRRPRVDSDQTISEMADFVAKDLGHTGAVLVIQPTVSSVTRHALKDMIKEGDREDRSLVAAQYLDHIQWKDDDTWSRQRHRGINYELGIYYWPAGHSPLAPITSNYLISGSHVDIDTPADFLAASYRPKDIQILVEIPRKEFGSGHWRRAETLQLALQHHNVVINGPMDAPPALVIYDRGDTLAENVVRRQMEGSKVMTIEDAGPGARHADLVINSFIKPLGIPTERTGPDWAILRSEFMKLPTFVVNTPVNRVLIVFGGTDPRDLTTWAKDIVAQAGYRPVIHKGPGLAEAMLNADILISGAGRTVQEAAYVGLPTIVLPGTLRESTHTHLGPHRGNLVLGQPATVSSVKLLETIQNVAGDVALRREMSSLAKSFVDGKGLQRVVHEIEGLLI